MDEQLIKRLKEDGKLLTLKPTINLSDLNEGDEVTWRVRINDALRFFIPSEEENGDPENLKCVPYTHLLLTKGLGENKQEVLYEIKDAGWDYSTYDDGSIVEYEEDGEKYCELLAVYTLGKRIV